MRGMWIAALLSAAVANSSQTVFSQTRQAQRANLAGQKPPELIATISHSLGWGAVYSRGPRVGVYRDGTVIFAKRVEEAAEASYFRAALSLDEFQQVEAALVRSYAAMDKDIHLAPGWHDLPSITLAIRSGNESKAVTVEGFRLQGHYAPPATDKRKRPDRLPKEIDRAAKMLLYLDPANVRPWEPEFFELRLTTQMNEVPERIHPWPQEWPDLKSRLALQLNRGRRDAQEFSLVLTSAEHARFLELEETSRYFQTAGKTWSAHFWLPLLPDSERLRQYQAVPRK